MRFAVPFFGSRGLTESPTAVLDETYGALARLLPQTAHDMRNDRQWTLANSAMDTSLSHDTASYLGSSMVHAETSSPKVEKGFPATDFLTPSDRRTNKQPRAPSTCAGVFEPPALRGLSNLSAR